MYTTTYQICRTEENNKSNNHKLICNLTPEVRDILKILWKRGEIAPKGPIYPLFPLMLDFHVKTGTIFSFQDKRLFDISEVKIKRVNYMYIASYSHKM